MWPDEKLLNKQEKTLGFWYDALHMPFLTRDFAVFLGLVAFLISGITATATKNIFGDNQVAALVTFADIENGEFNAVVPKTDTEVGREGRLSELKAKVQGFLASSGDLLKPNEVKEPESALVENNNTNDLNPGSVFTCSEYANINPAWSPKGLKFDTVEGALIIYREKEVVNEVINDISTTTEAVLLSRMEREVVLQLPARLFPQAKSTCLLTDVIGVALDGSLIRNGDYIAYGVFGSETLVGYALDGFAIYGSAAFKTDSCGGSDVSGEYRYYLNKDRKGVIGCFSATPVNI